MNISQNLVGLLVYRNINSLRTAKTRDIDFDMSSMRLLLLLVLCSFAQSAAADIANTRSIADYCRIWDKSANPPKRLLMETEKAADVALKNNPEDWGALQCKIQFVVLHKDNKAALDIARRLESTASNEDELAVAWSYISVSYKLLDNKAESLRYAKMLMDYARRDNKAPARR